MDAGVPAGPGLHLPGATAATLMFGPSRAPDLLTGARPVWLTERVRGFAA